VDNRQDDFLRELLADFKTEAAEHHSVITDGLLKLEKQPSAELYKTIIETTFREFHSLKGAARAVNQIDIERICQSMESVFQQLKQGSFTLNPPLFDLLYKGLDFLNTMLAEIDVTKKTITSGVYLPLLKAIENAIKNFVNTQKPIEKAETIFQFAETEKNIEEFEPEPILSIPEVSLTDKQSAKDTVRISTRKLENLLRQAEEFIAIKATLGYYINEVQKSNHDDQSIIQRDLNQFHRNLSRMVDDMLFDIKSTLLFPFSSLLDIVPKIVRDLGKEFDKEIQLTIQGAEIEIDRRILEAMKDPLIHIIRNCIDHGLETAEVRLKKGKSASGRIAINITQEAGKQAILIISDDGAGINRQALTEKVIKSGLSTMEAISHLTDQELLSYIFRSGVSTSPIITDLSGRGLGMAIVSEKVSGLGGSIMLNSEPDQGTIFTITLPLTLSTFRGVLVKINEQQFIIPTTTVNRAIRIKQNEIHFAESKPFFYRNNESIALVGLEDALGIPVRKKQNTNQTYIQVLILSSALHKIGFIVDEVLGEQEGIVKELGPLLIHVRNIAGATLLGNGQVIPILSVSELIDSAMQSSTFLSAAKQEDETSATPAMRILVAEDSITSRTLLRNILETAGFTVKTAVDGSEAFQFIQSDLYDLVVSDVEMPNMNGFELTAKIRNDERFANTPVILVTALSSDIDKQRGMEAGANAYIVKSNFEQSNLVETIRRLI
jgi:two-component system chemotaxis sensor kinase CheA